MSTPYRDMTPQQRIVHEVENERPREIGHYLLEHLAAHGTHGIDAQALARRVFERMEEED